jgi:hypothetical protein
VLATCDGGLYINEYGKLEVFYEDTNTTPIALLNPQRIIQMVDQRSLERKPDGYAVEFIDKEADYTPKTHTMLRPFISEGPGLNYKPLKLDFTTGYYQAMWHARRYLAKEKHRPGEIKVTVGKEGRHYKPGSLIKVQHERFKIGLGSGEITQLIKSGNQIVGLKLMERFDISKDRDYWLEYYVVDEERNYVMGGKEYNKKIQIRNDKSEYTDILMLTAPISMDDAPAFMNILSVMYGEKDSITVQEAKRYIVADLSENPNGYDLTLVEYAQNIYDTGDIEERKSSILSAPPMVLADQQRNQQQALLDMLQALTTPQNIDRIAEGAFWREYNNNIGKSVSEGTPRYRGIFTNVNTINSTNFNLGDWIYYDGANINPTWVKGYIYRFRGTDWEKIPPPSEDVTSGWMWLDAVSSSNASIVDGAERGRFSDVFCKALTTTIAFIDSLFAQNITLRKDGNKVGVIQSEKYQEGVGGFYIDANGNIRIINGEITIGGACQFIRIGGLDQVIRTSNFIPGRLGWCIYPNGNVEFNNGVFRGILEAATLKANTLSINGGHEAGDGFVISEKNNRISNNQIADNILVRNGNSYKMIRVAGTGKCTLVYHYMGSCYIYVNGVIKNTASDLPASFHNSEIFTEKKLEITLDRNINTIEIEGWWYRAMNTSP